MQFLLKNSSKIDNLGELLAPLNVKYIILAKEIDFSEYFFLFKQNDLELRKETENLYLFQNNHEVVRLYQVDALSVIKDWDELLVVSQREDITDRVYLLGDYPEANLLASSRHIVNYEQVSPVKYVLRDPPTEGYVVLASTYSKYWQLGDREPLNNLGITNAYEVNNLKVGELEYRRFRQYLTGYIISCWFFISLIYIYYRKCDRCSMMNTPR